jgi:hypothetical protein
MRSKLYRIAFLIITLISLTVMVVAAQEATPDESLSLRTFQATDLGTFDYPLDTYSVRPGSSPNSDQIFFPGIISIEPNDSFLYGARRPNPGIIYQMQIAASPNENAYTADDLENLLGTLPLLQYDADVLAGLDVQHIELDGSPAVRVNNLPVGPGSGVTHIIALAPADNALVEFVISPANLFGAGIGANPSQGDPNVNRRILDNVVQSFQFLR